MANTTDKVKILTAFEGVPNSRALSTYQSKGGYSALKKALSMQPAQVIEEVKQSGLRGRGIFLGLAISFAITMKVSREHSKIGILPS